MAHCPHCYKELDIFDLVNKEVAMFTNSCEHMTGLPTDCAHCFECVKCGKHITLEGRQCDRD